MNQMLKILVVCMLFVGCTSTSTYKSSASNLLLAEYLQSNHGFLKSWKPIGKNYVYQLSEAENKKSSLDMDFCVGDLSSKYSPPPNETLRTLQIIECMEAKGWHLEIEEILITR